MSSASVQEKSPAAALSELAGEPARLLEYARQLQTQLAATRQELARKEQLLAATHQELAHQEQLLAEARAQIAELKRQLFGPTADKLNPEQKEQLRQVAGELHEHAQRPPPLSQDVLEPDRPPPDKEKLQRELRRRRQGVWRVSGARAQNRGGSHHRIRIRGRQTDLQGDGSAQIRACVRVRGGGGQHCPLAPPTGAAKQAGVGAGRLPAAQPL
jgi:exonuclease VII large subunit